MSKGIQLLNDLMEYAEDGAMSIADGLSCKLEDYIVDLEKQLASERSRMNRLRFLWDEIGKNMVSHTDTENELPTVVCLCGSTRFYEAYQEANFQETMAGKIVLTVGFYAHRPEAVRVHGEMVGITPEQKVMLDDLHKRKIDLADEILVLNVDGYIGSSTASEILYAHNLGKRIRWLEPDNAPLEINGMSLIEIR